MYDYSPLWQTMREMGITTYRLIKEGIDKKTLSNLQHNKNVTVLTLEKLCTILNCSVENVVRIVPEEKGEDDVQRQQHRSPGEGRELFQLLSGLG